MATKASVSQIAILADDFTPPTDPDVLAVELAKVGLLNLATQRVILLDANTMSNGSIEYLYDVVPNKRSLASPAPVSVDTLNKLNDLLIMLNKKAPLLTQARFDLQDCSDAIEYAMNVFAELEDIIDDLPEVDREVTVVTP